MSAALAGTAAAGTVKGVVVRSVREVGVDDVAYAELYAPTDVLIRVASGAP